ncbi:MAG: hypothetical protein L0Y62_02395, partial [Nitrospirae bacterium]|nr:hypothetical protein [Nitrospirota bacterium]
RDECAFLSQLTALEVNYPEPSFWTDLQMKVRQAAGEEGRLKIGILQRLKQAASTLMSRFLSPIPAAAVMAAAILLIFAYSNLFKKSHLMFDPFFADPLETVSLDYTDIQNIVVPLASESIQESEYMLAEGLLDYNYQKEFFYMSSDEIEQLYKSLDKKGKMEG